MQASWIVPVIWLCAVVLLGVLSPEPIWPWFPRHASRFHLFFWGLLIGSPAIALQLGWSYAMTTADFVVMRFGRERYRLPLHELKDVAHLRFAQGVGGHRA